MKDHEHNIQVACVRWFRYQYPNHIIYAVPNGGQRNAIIAAKLKAEGVLAGVPDLCIPVAKGSYFGLYVEMKAGKNKPTDEQREMMRRLVGEGYKCEVCWSFDEFERVVRNYFRQQ